ncbi:hypothetical protein ZRA01_38790 [Zoogloea ramigera]|uniref:Uncharacterized protein n=2 Tax=Zoogloea ramigera TaxID=350 RepID=A0A4Y4CZR2_ZOORA|nr:hypothetical protein ZRA01_38790 [Zoogloea ramigera]
MRHTLSYRMRNLFPAMGGVGLDGEGHAGRRQLTRETMMRHQGYAMYNATNNTLEVIRPGENATRVIRCAQIHPEHEQVHGVTIDGDAIRVYVGPYNNPRPTHTRIYSFMSLSGGRRGSL